MTYNLKKAMTYNLKKLAILALLLVAVAPLTFAATVEVDGIRYETNSDGTAYVTYYVFNNSSNGDYYQGDITIPETIEVDDDIYTVTSVRYYAFYGCKNLTSISLPRTITSIGEKAFYYCKTLQSIGDLPALTSIEKDAFYYCYTLQDVYLPETLKNLNSSAFSVPTLVHLAGVTPPAFSGQSFNTILAVPQEAYEAYATALPEIQPQYLLADNISLSYDVTVSALDSDSDLRNKVNGDSEQDLMYYVRDLKVTGTINSYDIMIIRNKMLNLYTLDLTDATIVANPYEYYTGYHTEDNVVGAQMFSNTNLVNVRLPKNTTEIGGYAFSSCKYLRDIILPETVTSIGYSAFSDCSELKKIIIPPLVEGIYNYCFWNCFSLSSISLPPTLKTIGGLALYNCQSLKEIRIPAGVTSIASSAFSYCDNLKDIYVYTIQPTNIQNDSFASSAFTSATLHVPETSEYLYYWDTQWSQFQTIVNFNEPYTYFYLEDKDLIEDPDTPRIDGETDEETGEKKNPDADLGSGSGLIVNGDDSQNLGNVDLENGASIIGGNSNTSESGGNVNIDMLNINLNVEANKWYFFSFPFDVKCSDIKFNGQMVWRYYDGEWRAMNGSGAWKDNKDEYLKRGKGYIFQGSKKGTLTLSIPNASFDAKDWQMELEQNVSEMAQDASWNFIGNPFMSYYELADLGFDGPITWWNPNTKSYEAFNPQDDDMSLYPFMAFFVQKPENVESCDFESKYRETNNQKNDAEAMKNARRRRMARSAAPAAPRLLTNLEISNDNGSDRTRIVLNDLAKASYEVGVDASKFVSTEAPQIYSLDMAGVRYAINELPDTKDAIRLGIYAPENGVFTIECTRTDCPMTLFDAVSKKEIELAPGQKYHFTAEQGYDDSRFMLRRSNDAVSVDAVNVDNNKASYYNLDGVKSEGSARGVMIEVNGKDVKKVIK